MQPKRITTDYIDSLRISPHEELELLRELSHPDADLVGVDERRREARRDYLTQAGLIVQIRHPGGSIANYLVRTRNLSTEGIGFVHGSFIYNGTPCIVALKGINGKILAVEGRVVRCRHIRRHFHDIGVKFLQPINLSQFLGGADDASGASLVSAELPRLIGRILCVDDSPNDQDLLHFHLQSVGIDATAVASAIDAVGLIDGAAFDAIITELVLPGMSGMELAEAARLGGHRGAIIALTADSRPELHKEALARGCSHVLVKPYQLNDFIELISAQLPHADPAPGQGPLMSELWSNIAMRPLICRFLHRLEAQIPQIRRLVDGGAQWPLLQRLSSDLKGSAGGYGYPQISQAATRLLDSVLVSSPDRNSVLEIAESLIKLCESATLLLNTVEPRESAA